MPVSSEIQNPKSKIATGERFVLLF